MPPTAILAGPIPHYTTADTAIGTSVLIALIAAVVISVVIASRRR